MTTPRGFGPPPRKPGLGFRLSGPPLEADGGPRPSFSVGPLHAGVRGGTGAGRALRPVAVPSPSVSGNAFLAKLEAITSGAVASNAQYFGRGAVISTALRLPLLAPTVPRFDADPTRVPGRAPLHSPAALLAYAAQPQAHERARAGGVSVPPLSSKAADQWQWSNGRDRSPRRERTAQSRRSHSKSHTRRRGAAAPTEHREKTRDVRARGQGDIRGGVRSRSRRSRSRRGGSRPRQRRDTTPSQHRDVEIEGPSEKGLYRVKCAFQTGRERGRTITSTGPWRSCSEKAAEDGEEMRSAFNAKGADGLNEAKNALYTSGASAPPPAQPVAVQQGSEQAGNHGTSKQSAPGATPWEIETQKEGRDFRAVCHFMKKVFYDEGNSRPCKLMGPWRTSRELAEQDAMCLCDAYDADGLSAAQKVKNELFESAFAKKPGEHSRSAATPQRAAGSDGGGGGRRSRSRGGAPRSQGRGKSAARQEHGHKDSDKDDKIKASCRFKLEHSDRGHRAISEFLPDAYHGDSAFCASRVSVTLPWRERRSQAQEDGDAVVAAYTEGGAAAAHRRKNEFFRSGALGAPPSTAAARSEAAESRGSSAGGSESGGVGADSRVEAVKGGFRAVCHFETNTNSAFRRSAGTMKITGPTRLAVGQASADADALEHARREDGITAVHKARNDLFRSAFTDKPVTDDFPVVESDSAEGAAVDFSVRSEIEVDRSSRGKGYRAACSVPHAGDEGFIKAGTPMSMVGPWRASRIDAQSDATALMDAYRSGGTEAAIQCKNDLRRDVQKLLNGMAVAAAVSEKLSKHEMVDKYGKGFLLAERMGYAGAGLGREGQGRELLVSLDGARSTVGTSARLGLGRSSSGRAAETSGAPDMDDDDSAGGRVCLGAGGSDVGSGRRGGITFERAGVLEPDTRIDAKAAVDEISDEDDRSEFAMRPFTRFRQVPAAPNVAGRKTARDDSVEEHRLTGVHVSLSGVSSMTEGKLLPPLLNPRAHLARHSGGSGAA